MEVHPATDIYQQALTLLSQQQFSQAVIACQQAIRHQPDFAEAYKTMGNALIGRGKVSAAARAFQKALAYKPDFAEAYYNLGSLAIQQGQLGEAERCYRAALANQPELTIAYSQLARVLQLQGKTDESLDLQYQLFQMHPEQLAAGTCFQLGTMLAGKGKVVEAIACLSQALATEPTMSEAHLNLGSLLAGQGELEQARARYLEALKYNPSLVNILCQIGERYVSQKQIAEALGCFDAAIATDAGNLVANTSKGRLLLLTGDLDAGFSHYEWRWQVPDFAAARRVFPQTEWRGESLLDKRILLWGEQGIGDEVLYAGHLTRLLATCRHCVLECDFRLVPLFQRSFPQIEVLPRSTPARGRLFQEDIDYQAPISSLARWVKLEPHVRSAYLRPDPVKVAACRQRYAELGEGRKVGISWHSTNKQKQLPPPALWESVLTVPGISWISLQYGDRAPILAGKPLYRDERIEPMQSLDDFAAHVAALDLVISISNTTVHVAGALGVPVWVLLPHVPELWYWFLEREDSPWYERARLFRQPAPGDWRSLFAKVADALSRLGQPGGTQ